MSNKTHLLMKALRLLIFVGSVALADFTSANAQVAFGVKGGLNVSRLSFDKDDDQVEVLCRPGFFIGPVVRLNLPIDGLGLDAAILYEQHNAKHKSQELVPKGEHATLIKQQQIAVPVNLRYDWDLSERWGIYAYTGPQVGFNVGKEIKMDCGSYVPTDVTVAINIGLGVTMTDHLQLSVSYLWCCNKTADIWVNRGYPHAMKIDKAHMNSWQFGLCYFF